MRCLPVAFVAAMFSLSLFQAAAQPSRESRVNFIIKGVVHKVSGRGHDRHQGRRRLSVQHPHVGHGYA